MKGFHINIEEKTRGNEYFRQVLYTAKHMQLVVMSLKSGEEIGEEIHTLDQFIRVEKGECVSVLDGSEKSMGDGDAVVIPAGTRHNIINRGSGSLKLYTIYAPAEHPDGAIQKTKEEAEAAEQKD